MNCLPYRELDLKTSYESGVDDLVQEFYVPVLSCATSYDRIAGFFSSSSLAIAARGIVGLIKNRGKMRLLASNKLSQDDASIITRVASDSSFFQDEAMINALESNIIDEFEESFKSTWLDVGE